MSGKTVAKKLWNVALFGAPGGGKGTISSKMLKEFPFTHVSLLSFVLKLNIEVITVVSALLDS